MSVFRIEVEGFDELKKDAIIAKKVIPPLMNASLKATGIKLKNIWKKNIRIFKAIDTGEYRDSVQYQPTRGVIGFEVGSDVPHAPFVEYGTSRMLPRPAMRAAETQIEGEFDRIFDKIWDKI